MANAEQKLFIYLTSILISTCYDIDSAENRIVNKIKADFSSTLKWSEDSFQELLRVLKGKRERKPLALSTLLKSVHAT